MFTNLRRLVVVGPLAVITVVALASPALAHERRTVGPVLFRVGWQNEPTYSGVRNGVQLFLSDAATNAPITDLGDTLKVQVITGSEKSDPLALKAAFGATFGTPGEYDAAMIPTRPGTYTFRFTGTVHGQPVDESFTSSDHTFDNVNDATGIEFPVKDPSNGELATKLDRLDPRIAAVQTTAHREAASAKDSASTARTVGVIGVVIGVLGLVAGIAGVVMARGVRRSTIASAPKAGDSPKTTVH